MLVRGTIKMKDIWNRFSSAKVLTIASTALFFSFIGNNTIADNHAEGSSSPHVWSANMMMVSEYVFRGITQSNEDPAIQVGIDYAHEPSGFYIGTWASSVEFNTGNADGTQLETNLYGGFAGSFANGIDWDIGGLYYYYPEEGDDDGAGEQDYVEVYGSLGYAVDAPLEPSISAGFAYSPDYYGEDGDGIWLHGTLGFTTKLGISPYVMVGYMDVDGDETTQNGYDYVMYSVGGSYDIGMFTLDLNWTEAESGVGKAGSSEATEAVIFSVSSSW